MMKSLKWSKNKRLYVMLFAVICLVLTPAQTFALSDHASGSLGGIPVSGAVYMDTAVGTQSASAETAIGGGVTAVLIQATVTYRYKFGPSNVVHTATETTTNGIAAGAYAVAEAAYTPAVPVSATGQHYVVYGGYTWSAVTSVAA
jgi:hypothetical protein